MENRNAAITLALAAILYQMFRMYVAWYEREIKGKQNGEKQV